MDILAEIDSYCSGPIFRRADLHIHSFEGSYDVTDNKMTPESIIDTAITEGLQIISITDHDSIINVKRAIEYAKDKNILLIPGVELSTYHGHLLVYCPSYELLYDFYGKLSFSDDPNGVRGRKICNRSIVECLEIAERFNGIGIASHIDIEAGFEVKIPTYDAFKQQILLCKNLLALEVSSITSTDWYTSNVLFTEATNGRCSR